MIRSQIRFEWYTGEEERRWAGVLADEGDSQSGSVSGVDRLLTLRLLQVLVLVTISMVALSGASYSQEERALLLAESGVLRTLALEQKARETKDPALFASLIDDQIDGEWTRTWSILNAMGQVTNSNSALRLLDADMADGLAVVKIWDSQSTLSWRQVTPFRETRFYRNAGENWVRTVPNTDFWGGPQLLKYDHLQFVFTARDRQTVEAITIGLDHAYAALHRFAKLDPTSQQLSIEIMPHVVRKRGVAADRLEITSPVLAQVPVGYSAADYLLHDITDRMIYQMLYRLLDRSPDEIFRFDTRILQRGFRSWLQAHLLGQRPPWDAQAEELLLETVSHRLPLTLSGISRYDEELVFDRERYMWRIAAARTLFDYAATRHGEEKVAGLIRSVNRLNSWRDLVRGIFDESVEEFETGWNAYLAETYP